MKRKKKVLLKQKGDYFLQNYIDIRYTKASIISVGEEVPSLKKDDEIFFDRHAGHKIEIKENTYHVIKLQDVVVVL